MPYVNQYSGCGRVVREPEFSEDKTPRIRFTIALNRPGASRPFYLDCVGWETQARSLAQFLTKGAEIFVVGELETNNYQDERTSWHRSTTLRVEKYSILGGVRLPEPRRLRPPV